jgi:hypothetical protein
MELLSPPRPFSIQGIPDPRCEGKEKQGPGDHSELLAQTRAFKVTVCDLEEGTGIGVFTREITKGAKRKSFVFPDLPPFSFPPYFTCNENGDWGMVVGG